MPAVIRLQVTARRKAIITIYSRRQILAGPSFRGGAAGGEPGSHIPEAGVHGFRAASLCEAPGMTPLLQCRSSRWTDAILCRTSGSAGRGGAAEDQGGVGAAEAEGVRQH